MVYIRYYNMSIVILSTVRKRKTVENRRNGQDTFKTSAEKEREKIDETVYRYDGFGVRPSD